MIKIRRKRLFEDDATVNNGQQPAQNTAPANGQPANNAAPAQPAAQNAQGQPDQNQQQNNTNQQQQPQQDQNQQQQNQQPNPTQQAIQELLKRFENIYDLVANNVPELIKEKIPDFKPENPQAAPIIKLWDAFKAQPAEQSFNAFIDALKNFGSAPADSQQNNNQQQQQQNEARVTSFNFTKALHERLNHARYVKMTEEYFK